MYCSEIHAKYVIYSVDVVVYGGRYELCGDLLIFHRGPMVLVDVRGYVVRVWIGVDFYSTYIRNWNRP